MKGNNFPWGTLVVLAPWLLSAQLSFEGNSLVGLETDRPVAADTGLTQSDYFLAPSFTLGYQFLKMGIHQPSIYASWTGDYYLETPDDQMLEAGLGLSQEKGKTRHSQGFSGGYSSTLIDDDLDTPAKFYFVETFYALKHSYKHPIKAKLDGSWLSESNSSRKDFKLKVTGYVYPRGLTGIYPSLGVSFGQNYSNLDEFKYVFFGLPLSALVPLGEKPYLMASLNFTRRSYYALAENSKKVPPGLGKKENSSNNNGAPKSGTPHMDSFLLNLGVYRELFPKIEAVGDFMVIFSRYSEEIQLENPNFLTLRMGIGIEWRF